MFIPTNTPTETRIIYGDNWEFEFREKGPEIEQRILRQAVIEGEYDVGIIATLEALEAHLGREIIIEDTKQSRGDGVTPWWLYAGAFGIGIVSVAGMMTAIEFRFYRD